MGISSANGSELDLLCEIRLETHMPGRGTDLIGHLRFLHLPLWRSSQDESWFGKEIDVYKYDDATPLLAFVCLYLDRTFLSYSVLQ